MAKPSFSEPDSSDVLGLGQLLAPPPPCSTQTTAASSLLEIVGCEKEQTLVFLQSWWERGDLRCSSITEWRGSQTRPAALALAGASASPPAALDGPLVLGWEDARPADILGAQEGSCFWVRR